MNSLTEKEGFALFQMPHSDEQMLLEGQWTNKPLEDTYFVVANSDGSEQFFLNGSPTLITKTISVSNNTDLSNIDSISHEDYIEKAKSFIKACDSELNKVILSRTKTVKYNNSNYFTAFDKLCKQYTNAFNYLINIPGIGMWMGATPELLLSKKSNQFNTVALAGSQPYEQFEKKGWKIKEQEEQQYVTDYISNHLELLGIKVQKSAPYTVKAGQIAHIKTDFSFTSVLGSSELINQLHPTPAVCGVPKTQAQDFILKNEGYSRKLYTGFLGISTPTKESYFVNLRCMEVFSDQVKLYIGGGITNKSIPEKEWQETELKSQTLLNILKFE